MCSFGFPFGLFCEILVFLWCLDHPTSFCCVTLGVVFVFLWFVPFVLLGNFCVFSFGVRFGLFRKFLVLSFGVCFKLFADFLVCLCVLFMHCG